MFLLWAQEEFDNLASKEPVVGQQLRKGDRRMARTLVVSSKIKELAKVGGMRASNEFIEELSQQVGLIVIEAAKRTKENKRAVIKARDIPSISFRKR